MPTRNLQWRRAAFGRSFYNAMASILLHIQYGAFHGIVSSRDSAMATAPCIVRCSCPCIVFPRRRDKLQACQSLACLQPVTQARWHLAKVSSQSSRQELKGYLDTKEFFSSCHGICRWRVFPRSLGRQRRPSDSSIWAYCGVHLSMSNSRVADARTCFYYLLLEGLILRLRAF